MRRRLDAELVRRGLCDSRARVVEAVGAGRVLVGGAPAGNPDRHVADDEAITVTGPPPPFVSRGGEKLAAALDAFPVTVAGRRALDAGASTGGFTDCLLQRGAHEVVAVDVGRGQLAWALQSDPRVRTMDRVNVRNLEAADIGGTVPLAVADLSFISLLTVAPALARCTTADADLVLLVKPQFEAGRARVGKGGIVRDPEVHRDVLQQVAGGLAAAGLPVVAAIVSPITGADGNREFLVHVDRAARAGRRRRAGERRVTGARPRVVGMVPHHDRPLAAELARAAADRFVQEGITVRVPTPDATIAGLDEFAVAPETFADGLDIALSLGGDGTMLRTVDLVYEAGAAVLGINVGQLGYLAEVEPPDVDAAIERLLGGDYEVEERMVLQVEVTSTGAASGRWWALNEAVIEKEQPGRLVRLDVEINRAFFTTYAADGVIVATPTGSTAYSFSARGPIVSPRHRCLLLTPVSPHMLFDRSLVLDADEELRFTVTDGRCVVLTLDGRELGRLVPGDAVSCTVGPKPGRIVTFGPRDFHQILKAKFGLADR